MRSGGKGNTEGEGGDGLRVRSRITEELGLR